GRVAGLVERPTGGAPATDGPAEVGQQSLFEEEEGSAGAALYRLDAGDGADRYSPEDADYQIIRTRAELARLVQRLADAGTVSVDTETTSIDPMWASLVGLSFSKAPNEAAFVPTPLPDGTSTEEVLDALRPLLESPSLKVGQNIKYDLIVLARHGASVSGGVFDTMIAHYLIAPEESHALDALALKYLGYSPIPISDLLGTGRSQISMRDVALEQIGPYACEDADLTLRLHDRFLPALHEGGVSSIASDIEFPLVRVLADMERVGVRVDAAVLREISAEMEADLAHLQDQIYELAGEEFNIGSPAQLGEILFERLKLPIVSRTSTGKASTRERVLQELATEHALPGLILDWRELSKLRNTYVDTLPQLIHPETGRVHTSYNQSVAATGRLSSSNPNLQNIPVRSERGRAIRRAFVAGEGLRLMSADYVQIELRILASMSGDEELAAAFRRGDDIHTATAARVFGVEPQAVTREQRSRAKEVNYGIPYGISAFGLAQRLRCPVSEAQELIDQYLRSYPRITQFLRLLVDRAKERGYAETLLGRRRYVPAINAKNRVERSAAERIAVNM
ncbi:MAG: DNA polymerase, partial [Synechococcaceae cyanobacterium]|nr:DNA polymerase [Synechococcaceae cyanobacterium]